MSTSSSSSSSNNSSASNEQKTLQPRYSNMIPSIQDGIKIVYAEFKKVLDNCNVLGFRLENIESCRANKALPHNLSLKLAPCQYPSFMDIEIIDVARNKELLMFQNCLYKIEEDRFIMFNSASAHGIHLSANWNSSDFVQDQIIKKASSDIQEKDVLYGLQEFSVYDTFLRENTRRVKLEQQARENVSGPPLRPLAMQIVQRTNQNNLTLTLPPVTKHQNRPQDLFLLLHQLQNQQAKRPRQREQNHRSGTPPLV